MLFRIFRFRPKAKSAPAKPPRPRPATTHDNQWWFDALNEGFLAVQKCDDCGAVRFPTGPMCPECRSLSWSQVAVPPSGTIHSFVVVHYPQIPSFDYPLPIVLVEVDPPAGGTSVRMIMNVADAALEDIVIGARVRIDIRATDADMKLPFALIESAPSGGAK